VSSISQPLRTDAVFSAVAGEKWWIRPEDAPRVSVEGESPGAFVAVVGFTLILLLVPQVWFPILGKLRIAFLTAGGAGAFLLWDRWKQREPLLNLSTEMLVGLGLLAWAFMTLPLSYWPGGSVALLSELYLKALAIFWLLANVIVTLPRLRLMAMTLILCTVPLSVTGLKNFVSGNFMLGGQTPVVRILGYQAGLAGNPNDLALMLNLILPLVIATFLGSAKPSLRILCLIVVGLNVLCVILTFSRGGFIGLATIALIYVARLIRRPGSDRPWAFAAIVVAVLCVPLLPPKYVDRITNITNIDADATGSSQARWDGTLAAIRAIKAHPVAGAGIGMDMLALSDAGVTGWTKVHNVYLQYAVDLGLPGLVLFLVLLRGVFKQVRAARRRVANVPSLRSLFLLVEGVEISLIVFAIEGFFHPVAYNFYFYFIGGLALATRVVTNHEVSVARA
jgi:O-antigen ligase